MNHHTICMNKKVRNSITISRIGPYSSAILKCSNLHSYYKHEIGDSHSSVTEIDEMKTQGIEGDDDNDDMTDHWQHFVKAFTLV